MKKCQWTATRFMMACGMVFLATLNAMGESCATGNCDTGDVRIDIMDKSDPPVPKLVFCTDESVKLVAYVPCTVFDINAGFTCHWTVGGTVLSQTDQTVNVSTIGYTPGTITVDLCVDGTGAPDTPAAGQAICRKTSNSFTLVKLDFTAPFGNIHDRSSADLDITVAPATAGVNQITFSSKPFRQDWQNEINSVTHSFKKRGTNLEWEVEKAIWYGSPSDSLCADNFAKHTISLKARITVAGESVWCQARDQNLWVDLNDGISKMTPSVMAHQAPKIKGFQSEGSPGWCVKVEVKDRPYTKSGTTTINATSQYKAKTVSEENRHVWQWFGTIDPADGGCADLCHPLGIVQELVALGGAANGQTVIFCGFNSEHDAELAGNESYTQAFASEIVTSKALWTSRRCFLEKTAKDFVNFREAYTFVCTYPGCPANPPPFTPRF